MWRDTVDTHIRSPEAFNPHIVVGSIDTSGSFNARVLNYDRNGNALRGMGRGTSVKFDEVVLEGGFWNMTAEQVVARMICLAGV